MSDPYDLRRFVDAQEPVFPRVLAELRAGRKESHWMWFVFPQVAGLGRTGMARRYAIASRAEAEAYLAHPVLGPRLRQCCDLLAAVEGRSARAILGTPDDLKLRSCLTLFAGVAADNDLFERLLRKFYDGDRCRHTADVLAAAR
jgi:uncharacterized protein (DUF1810 family)